MAKILKATEAKAAKAKAAKAKGSKAKGSKARGAAKVLKVTEAKAAEAKAAAAAETAENLRKKFSTTIYPKWEKLSHALCNVPRCEDCTVNDATQGLATDGARPRWCSDCSQAHPGAISHGW